MLLLEIIGEVEELHAGVRGVLREGCLEFVGGDVAVEHEFPVAHADRAAVGHGVDEDVLVRRCFAVGDHGPDIAAIERRRLMERSAGEIL
ncbi:MAG: hypothetical protein ACK56I_15510, partial [bacterium]